MTRPWAARPGAASLALLLILVITAAWWALALWPVGTVEPAWLLRTRAACFGSAPGGLPDAGGWVLLIGEPIGMLGVLLLVWGGALRDDLQRLRADRRWRPLMVAVVGERQGMTVLTGHCLDMASPPPYQPTIDHIEQATRNSSTEQLRAALGENAPEVAKLMPSLRQRYDDIPPPPDLPPEQERRYMLHGVGEFIERAARNRPLLLVFEDLHWADESTLLLLRHLGPRAPEVPLLIISLDPWRDTPERLPSIASQWELGPEDLVLSGRVEEVEQTLDALGVGRRRDGSSGAVYHSGTVMLLDDRGHIVWRLDGGWGRATQLLASMP